MFAICSGLLLVRKKRETDITSKSPTLKLWALEFCATLRLGLLAAPEPWAACFHNSCCLSSALVVSSDEQCIVKSISEPALRQSCTRWGEEESTYSLSLLLGECSLCFDHVCCLIQLSTVFTKEAWMSLQFCCAMIGNPWSSEFNPEIVLFFCCRAFAVMEAQTDWKAHVHQAPRPVKLFYLRTAFGSDDFLRH